MATINDVAKKAGVGVSTVSKVLNHYDNISAETRAKVLKAVDDLNYVPNAVASALSSKHNKRIAIVIFINPKRQAIDEINMQYLFGAFNRSKHYKFELVTVFSTMFEMMNKNEMIQYFKSLQVQALIVFGLGKDNVAFTEMIQENHFYSVMTDVPFVTSHSSSVMVDHTKAQYEVVKHMIDVHNGFVKRIVYLAGKKDGYITDLRLDGILQAQKEFGFNLNVKYANFSERRAKELALEYAEEADIIVCASDLMALGAIHALKDMDIFRPVCGFDGIKLLGYLNYRIVSVCQDFYKTSEAAVDAVYKLIQGEPGSMTYLNYRIASVDYEDVIS